MKFAVIADLHYSRRRNAAIPARRGEFAALLLRRALEYLRILGDIDAVCLAGDLVDEPGDAGLLAELAAVAAASPAPLIAIPGNHDPSPEVFYRYFPRLDHLDAGGCRIIPFADDPELPGYHAERLPEELARAERLAAEFPGEKIFLQHVPLFPEGVSDNVYGYCNASEIAARMRRLGVGLSVSGHQHWGVAPYGDGRTMFRCTPALCESPFRFDIIEVGGGARTVELRLPEGVGFEDLHTHSPFAYCNENMDWRMEKELMDCLNLDRIAVTEHTAHLEFGRDDYLRQEWFRRGLDFPGRQSRVGEYLAYLDAATASGDGRVIRGAEVDVDCRGRLVLPPELERGARLRLGAVHALDDRDCDQFMTQVRGLVESGRVQVLAHPLRIFSWRGAGEKPARLFGPLVGLLRANAIAVELNFHCNRPDPAFMKLCLEAGLKFSLGSDAHNLYEVGFFNPHLDFIRSLGYDGDLREILFRFS